MKPRIAITMGDPAGIGPEICLQLLSNAQVGAACVPLVFGDADVLRRVAEATGAPPPQRVVPYRQWPEAYAELSEAAVVDLAAIPASAVRPGHVDPAAGQASFDYLDAALRAALADEVAALTTGPIHKEAWHAAGIRYPGHTELLGERTEAPRVCMMLTSEPLTCSLVTTHAGLRDVPDQLTVERVLDAIELTADCLARLRGRPARIAVCGLNPHAGEHGLFGGGEEEEFIAPAIAAAQADGLDVQGPLVPDTAFLPHRRQQFDAYVCMYHDQGLIPLKLLAFDSAVNVTLGLPIIRTSVDHGTAFDIAWRGQANPQSLVAAVLLAARLAEPA